MQFFRNNVDLCETPAPSQSPAASEPVPSKSQAFLPLADVVVHHTDPSVSLDTNEKTKLLLKIRQQKTTIQVLTQICLQKDKISKQEKIIESLQQQLDDKNTKMAKFEEERSEKQQIIKSLRQQLVDKNTKMVEIEEKQGDQQKTIESLHQQLKGQKSQLDKALLDQQQITESHRQQLDQKNKDLEGKLSDLEKLKEDHAKLKEAQLNLLEKYVALRN